MSSGGAKPQRPPRTAELDELELAVRRLLDDHDQWRRRAELAERRVAELEAALRDVSGGKLNPLELSARIETLEAENRGLRERLAQARDNVKRILGRLQFLEVER